MTKRRCSLDTPLELLKKVKIQEGSDEELPNCGLNTDRLDAVDCGLDAVDCGLNTVDGRLNTVDGRLNTVDGRLNTVDGRLNTVDGRLNTVDGRLHGGLNTVDRRLLGTVDPLHGIKPSAQDSTNNPRTLLRFNISTTQNNEYKNINSLLKSLHFSKN
jgi:hypothetical protein